MNISDYLHKATDQLREAGIESARLDCTIVLEDVIGKDRSWLLAHGDYELTTEQLSRLTVYIDRRTQHEPLAYIRGKVAFYGREFRVNSHALIPRPETESFIELLKDYKLNKKFIQILDLGTGSGCIGITLALELPHATVTLTDIDAPVLHLARENAEILDATVDFMRADLLSRISMQFDVIVTNLPYVPDNYPVLQPVSFEPKQALFAGIDGMDLYRQFWSQIEGQATKPSIILTEALLDQHTTQTQLARRAGYRPSNTQGLVQLYSLATKASY